MQQLGLVGQDRHRRVGAHRAHRLLAGVRHRRHQELEALLRVAERLLQIEQRDIGLLARDLLGQRQVADLHLRALQPLLVGIARGEIGLEVVIGDDATFLEVDQQHLAGLKAPLLRDVLLGHREHAGLRRHHHAVVLGDEVACGPQPVAVERGADLAPVRERHGGRAVPRLHQAGVVLVEGAPLAVHQRVAGPCLGDQHHRRMREAVASHDEELERVVEAGGIRLALVGDRPQLGDVGPEKRRGHRGLPRRHPVDVATQRVDLAVVGDHAVGVGQLPRRERVGGEALVHERHRRGEARVGQVVVVGLHLVGQEHALVDQRAARQRHRVVADVLALVGEVEGVGDDLADEIEAPLELMLVLHRLGARDEELAMHRLGRLHHLRETAVVDRNGAPAEELQSLLADDAHPHALAVRAQALVLRHEEVANGVVAELGKLDAEARAFLAQKLIRYLDEDARAVARERVRAHGSAMLEVLEDGERVLYQLMRFPRLQVGDEADAARVVLAGRVEQAARPRADSCSFRMLRALGHFIFERHGLSPFGSCVPPRGRSSFCAHRAPSPRTPTCGAKVPIVARSRTSAAPWSSPATGCAAAAPPYLPDRMRGCAAASGGAGPCGRSPQFASAHATR